MIKSMTGFASLTREDERGVIGLTIRAVNHRFLDMRCVCLRRLPIWSRGCGRCCRSG
jgi:uncharacterized protein YicC (UPF0701 family)